MEIHLIMDSGNEGIKMAKESKNGRMEALIMANGKKAKCMAKEN